MSARTASDFSEATLGMYGMLGTVRRGFLGLVGS